MSLKIMKSILFQLPEGKIKLEKNKFKLYPTRMLIGELIKEFG